MIFLMNHKIINTLASVALLFSAGTAFADYKKRFNLYNPNPAPLTVVNTISEVSGSVAGFVDFITLSMTKHKGLINMFRPIETSNNQVLWLF